MALLDLLYPQKGSVLLFPQNSPNSVGSHPHLPLRYAPYRDGAAPRFRDERTLWLLNPASATCHGHAACFVLYTLPRQCSDLWRYSS